MSTTVKSVTVDAPVSVAYNTWTQFEDFPLFMGGVQEVRQLDDSRLHWVAEIGGVKREWDATILEQVPDQKVSWAATEGATNAGSVHFTPSGPDRTTVTLTLDYEPEGLVEKAGDLLNIVERRAEADMENFKRLIETGDRDQGGWRGAVNPGAGIEPDTDDATSQGDSGKAGVSGKAVAAGVVAAAAAAATGAAVARSGNDTQTETTDIDVEPVDVVVTDTVTPVEVVETDTVAPVDVVETEPVLAPAAGFEGSDATQTYPVADDPTPFDSDRGDEPQGGHRTI